MTELESLSKLKMAGRFRYWRGTIEIPEIELHAICDEIQAEHDRAIAATLGSGTCELKHASWDDGQCTWGCICSACDARFEHETGIGYNYCPNCGAKVIQGVDNAD